jgi:hypothetical protein
MADSEVSTLLEILAEEYGGLGHVGYVCVSTLLEILGLVN